MFTVNSSSNSVDAVRMRLVGSIFQLITMKSRKKGKKPNLTHFTHPKIHHKLNQTSFRENNERLDLGAGLGENSARERKRTTV
jgi:hypothetical protein